MGITITPDEQQQPPGPTITISPAEPLRDPRLDVPPPYSMENKFITGPVAPPPQPITTTVYPKGGVPALATPAEQQQSGLIDAMSTNVRKQEEMKRDYGPWMAAGISMGNQFGNNLLAVPSVVGDVLSAPLRDVYAMSQGQPIPKMIGATPRVTVDKVVGAQRGFEAALHGQDPVAAYNNARSNIDIANNAMQQQYPTATTVGGVGGDVATLLAGRMPFTRAPGIAAAPGALPSATMAPGAAKVLAKAWEATGAKLGRPLVKAGEVGAETAAIAALHGDSPVKPAAYAMGAQLGGSGALWFMHSPKAWGAVAGLWGLYNVAQQIIPGGDNRWGTALQEAVDHQAKMFIGGLVSSAFGAGRFKGSPHQASKFFAENMPLLADGINLAIRTGPEQAFIKWFHQDSQSAKPVVGPLLSRMISNPGAFTSQEMDGFARSLRDGSFKSYIENMMGNESFRTRLGL